MGNVDHIKDSALLLRMHPEKLRKLVYWLSRLRDWQSCAEAGNDTNRKHSHHQTNTF